MAKPATKPRFGTGGGALTTEPTEGKKDSGWLVNEKPPAQVFNWIHKWTSAWIDYLDGLAGEAITWTAAHIHSALVTFNAGAVVNNVVLDVNAGLDVAGGASVAGGLTAVNGLTVNALATVDSLAVGPGNTTLNTVSGTTTHNGTLSIGGALALANSAVAYNAAGYQNELRLNNLIRAVFSFSFSTNGAGDPSFSQYEGFNFLSATRFSNFGIRLTLANGIADSAGSKMIVLVGYNPQGSAGSRPETVGIPYGSGHSASEVDLFVLRSNDTLVDLSAVDLIISFHGIVLGIP